MALISRQETKTVNEYRKFSEVWDLDNHKRFCLGLPVPKYKHGNPPFGYDDDPDNPEYYKPDEFALRLLLRSVLYIKDYGYRDVAQWLTEHAGRTISKSNLHKLVLEGKIPFNEIMLPIEEREKLFYVERPIR